MHIKYCLVLLAVFIGVCSFHQEALAQDVKNERHIEVVIRTIGHEVMLAHGDSTSRVLPVEQDGDQYRIRFETEFQFNAVKLITAVDKVVKRTDLTTNYLVQMQDCKTEDIIYSYEVFGVMDLNKNPCTTRAQPIACYNLLFTIMDDEDAALALANYNTPLNDLSTANIGTSSMMYLVIPLVLLFVIGIYISRNKNTTTSNPNVIAIGSYQFDKRNMILSLADNKIELTSKESDLLVLLRSSANTTIERDDILRHVWGDKGDYIGRTLDVFISKLRKKLEGDPTIKIANIRGVGYRLVLNEI